MPHTVFFYSFLTKEVLLVPFLQLHFDANKLILNNILTLARFKL